MAQTTVRFQPTPNPNAGKFTLSCRVVEGRASKSFYNPEDAADNALAAALFELEGVVNIFMADDFVTVTKAPDVEWQKLIPEAQGVLERVLG